MGNDRAKNWDRAGVLTRVSSRYAELFPLRAALQLLPYVGGSLDTVFAGMGTRWQYQRLEHFIKILDQRLQELEKLGWAASVAPSEELFDFFMQIFDNIVRN